MITDAYDKIFVGKCRVRFGDLQVIGGPVATAGPPPAAGLGESGAEDLNYQRHQAKAPQSAGVAAQAGQARWPQLGAPRFDVAADALPALLAVESADGGRELAWSFFPSRTAGFRPALLPGSRLTSGCSCSHLASSLAVISAFSASLGDRRFLPPVRFPPLPLLWPGSRRLRPASRTCRINSIFPPFLS
jgi:hypothetical protein